MQINEKIKKSIKENISMHSKTRTAANVIIHTGLTPITYHITPMPHILIFTFLLILMACLC